MTALLEMRGIVKCFGTLRANDGIDLDVQPGQIVGLLGENGSGKSTLMKVLFGMLRPDAGAIVFKGRELSGHSPREAMAAGITMIHQHFMLIEAMTVVENVMLGWPEAGNVLQTATMEARIREASQRASVSTSIRAHVSPRFRSGGASASRSSRRSCGRPNFSSSTSRPPISRRRKWRICYRSFAG